MLCHIERTLEVDVDNRVKVLLGHIEHKLVARDTGVVDENINLAEVGDHLLDNCLAGCKVADVAVVSLNLDSESLNSFKRRVLVIL